MGVLLELIVNLLDPLHLFRKHLFRPLLAVGFSVYDHFRNKTKNQVLTLRDLILRFGVISFTVALIIWSAIFMYVTFYYAYMPAISHTRPVHMQFKTCLDTGGPCSFPYAHVSLTKKQQLLMMGQSYKVQVMIDMPESPQNQDLGMFMVCGELRDQESSLRGHSCRTAMMRYRSPLIQTISTWVLGPLLILGLKDENQRVPVEIFPKYIEERYHPITDVYVEVQSQKIQFYSVTLSITADFTGLRYIMFNWPWLSAVVGVSTNLIFILIVFTLSWYHWSDTTWLKEAAEKYREHRRTRSGGRRRTLKRTDSDRSFKDGESFEDEEDISFLEAATSKSEIVQDFSPLEGEFEVHSTSDDEETASREPTSTRWRRKTTPRDGDERF